MPGSSFSSPSTFTRTLANHSSERAQARAAFINVRPVLSNKAARTLIEPQKIVETTMRGSTINRLHRKAIGSLYKERASLSDQKQRAGDHDDVIVRGPAPRKFQGLAD